MRLLKRLSALLLLVSIVACVIRNDDEEAAQTGTSQAAVECVTKWNATWQQGPGANNWWIEYVIGGDTVSSAWLEVVGRGDVPLKLEWNKWSASTAKIDTGASVVLHAINSRGEPTQSASFRYLVDTAPPTATCATQDAGGTTDSGSCPWNATWQQGPGANNWWVEYAIGGATVSSAYLEVVGRGNVALRLSFNKWVGETARIETGQSVVVHAVNSAGQETKTVPFGYLVTTNPTTASCNNPPPPPPPPPDAGSCSTWPATFSQTSSANNWWIEYVIGGGTVSSAQLEVIGRGNVTLNQSWGKWVGSTAKIETGQSVKLHAVNSAGVRASSTTFRYLVDQTPQVAPCTAPGESGLDGRPSNTSCVAQPRPATSNTMRFVRVYPNVAIAETIQIAQPPGDSSRFFVFDRQGRLWSFPNTANATATQVANLATIAGKPVRTELSGGLLGFAFHPSFSTNGRIYVSFTTLVNNVYNSEVGYITSTNGGQSFSSYTKVFAFQRAELEWNGGSILFGPDRNLYLGFGASEADGAQLKTTYYGKILRLDVDHPSGGRQYGIPATNPFAAGGGLPEIYALGFRQPWRMSFDRSTGDFWVADVGQSSWEEVDRVEVGKNYGWPCREGAHFYNASDPNKCPSTSGLTDPVYEYAANGPASAIGGYVYRGPALPSFNGTYVFGDQVRNVAYAFRYDASTGRATTVPVNEGGASIGFTSFAEDNAGEIYATAVFQAGVYKLVPSTGGTSTFPDRLSVTGCFDTSKLVPYTVNAPLWSDGFDKDRFTGLPNGTTISVRADGDFDLPIGSVLVKTFSTGGRKIETRLFMRHTDGDWAGYSYEWNDAQTDALLLADGKTKAVGTTTWTFPSRSDCLRCHTVAAGRTLGLELGQLNRDFTYPSTGRTANQLKTWSAIGMFASALPASPPAYPQYGSSAPVDARARSYLHANCSNCHRPGGEAGRATMDLRYATTFASTNTCNVTPAAGDLGIANAKLLDPTRPESSIISLRVHTLDGNRMPPLASRVVDTQGVGIIDDWIRGVTSCP